jgi:hypothetical protein
VLVFEAWKYISPVQIPLQLTIHHANVSTQRHIDCEILYLHRRIGRVYEENILGFNISMDNANLVQTCAGREQLLSDVFDVVCCPKKGQAKNELRSPFD